MRLAFHPNESSCADRRNRANVNRPCGSLPEFRHGLLQQLLDAVLGGVDVSNGHRQPLSNGRALEDLRWP